MNTSSFRSPPPRTASSQRGVVLLFSLIALVVVLIASVALVRSFNTTLASAGNIAFKRDLQNQAERAIPKVLQALEASGALGTAAQRAATSHANHYSAVNLATNAQGIPNILLGSMTDFDSTWNTNPIVIDDSQKVTVRYVVDRLCSEEGLDTVLGTARCQISTSVPGGGSGSHLNVAEKGSSAGGGAVALQIIYRVTIRVDGPRNTQAFYQTTFTL